MNRESKASSPSAAQFRPYPPAPSLCDRCWRERGDHAGPERDCPPEDRDPGFGASGW